ncbi:hypothetical protein KEM54_006016 [Ascosphaera aggregata]|nr:hypothetical protein KEM54_006016 [Ascosphaera aggregata]
MGGSTNAVLHLIAMAKTAEVNLTLEDFQRVSDKIPFLANLAPTGKFYMADLYEIGGVPSVQKLLIEAGLLNGNIPTVTGKTLAENIAGNLAPGGAVAKITGKEGTKFTGTAVVFNKEHELNEALDRGEIARGKSLVSIVRYEGPKGGPGMPEQLKASAALMGANLTTVALITDAAVGGPLAILCDGDVVTIDAENNTLAMDISDEEIEKRMKEWRPPKPHVTRGTLAKYAKLVGDASHGALTDLF